MNKFLFLLLLVSIFSCSPPKYKYVFDLRDADVKKSSSTSGLLYVDRAEVTASVSDGIRRQVMARADTVIHPKDSTSTGPSRVEPIPEEIPDPKKVDLERKKANYEKQKAFEEARKAYEEAKKEAKKAESNTKDKGKNVFAFAGFFLVILGVLSVLSSPAAFFTLILIGVLLAVIGMKSRQWGWSIAAFIIAIVITSMALMTYVINGEWPDNDYIFGWM